MMIRRLTAYSILVLLLFVTAQSVFAGQPMPYTDEGLSKLNQARANHGDPGITPGNADAKVRLYIERQRSIFARAGYDYDRSIIKIINDIQFDRYVVNKATIELNRLARELLRLHIDTGINPKTYLGFGFGQLLIDFRDLIRSNSKKYGGC
jgi:hypothetical protein